MAVSKVTLIKDKIETYRLILLQFLTSKGVEIAEPTLENLLNSLDELLILNAKKQYNAIEVDQNHYIKSVARVDYLLEAKELPIDVSSGYYKLIYTENGLDIVEDENKKYELFPDTVII